MNTADTIYELVKTLPDEQANAVLVFAEFVQKRTYVDRSSEKRSLSDYFGILKNSPNFNEDPVEI
jgi:Protein of unknown function (DUF2281)